MSISTPTAAAAASSSSSATPRARLYPHVLGSIYSFLRLADLVAVTSVSKLWLESVVSAPCISGVLPRVCKLVEACSSALATQLSSCEDQGTVSVEQMACIARGCPNLTLLRCELPLPAPPSARTLVFPPKIAQLSLRIPFGTPVARIHAVFTILSFLPHLTRIHLTLPTCDPTLSFAALRRAALQHLQIEWTWAVAALSDAHIAQLGSIQHLRTLLLPSPNTALMQRLFKPGHPFKMLQRFSHLSQLDDKQVAMLVAVPSLTSLSLDNCLADLTFLTQLPNLASLRVSISPQSAVRSCLSLLDCPRLTDLSLALFPITESDLCELLTKHVELRSLTVQMAHMSSLRFLCVNPHNSTLTRLTLTQLEPRLLRADHSPVTPFVCLRALTELRLHCAERYSLAPRSDDAGIPAHVLDAFRIPCEALPKLTRLEVKQPWERERKRSRANREEL